MISLKLPQVKWVQYVNPYGRQTGLVDCDNAKVFPDEEFVSGTSQGTARLAGRSCSAGVVLLCTENRASCTVQRRISPL